MFVVDWSQNSWLAGTIRRTIRREKFTIPKAESSLYAA